MIALFAILIALVAIIIKIFTHIQYVNNSIESPDIPDFVGALSPTFIRKKDKEQSDKNLKKLGNRIMAYLIIFYSSIVIFFAYTAF